MKRTITGTPMFKILSVMIVVFCLVSGAFAIYFYRQYEALRELKPRRQIFQNRSNVTLVPGKGQYENQ
jgi:hypothetical protein